MNASQTGAPLLNNLRESLRREGGSCRNCRKSQAGAVVVVVQGTNGTGDGGVCDCLSRCGAPLGGSDGTGETGEGGGGGEGMMKGGKERAHEETKNPTQDV